MQFHQLGQQRRIILLLLFSPLLQRVTWFCHARKTNACATSQNAGQQASQSCYQGTSSPRSVQIAHTTSFSGPRRILSYLLPRIIDVGSLHTDNAAPWSRSLGQHTSGQPHVCIPMLSTIHTSPASFGDFSTSPVRPFGSLQNDLHRSRCEVYLQ